MYVAKALLSGRSLLLLLLLQLTYERAALYKIEFQQKWQEKIGEAELLAC
jgi:hypothetical protein